VTVMLWFQEKILERSPWTWSWPRT